MSRIKKRKVKSFNKKVKKKKRMSKQLIWTLILAGLMIASVFGIMFSGYAKGGEKEPYGDYVFRHTANGWEANIDGKDYIFQHHPADLDELKIPKDVAEKLQDTKVMYITFNPNTKNVNVYELFRYELSNFLTFVQVYAMPGITEENEDYNQPIVDCMNATSAVPVLDVRESNSTKLYLDGDCIVVETDTYDAGPLVDRISFSYLGVIKDE